VLGGSQPRGERVDGAPFGGWRRDARSGCQQPGEVARNGRPLFVLERELIDYGAFDVLTFDCYGTLIDWEAGIMAALRGELGAAVAGHGDEELLAAFADVEHAAEVPYKRYREVLEITIRGVGERLDVPVDDEAARRFGASVGDWPPFPDSSEALLRLQQRFKLAVITNCDDDLFEASRQRLGIAFDHVITAQQVGSYKPDLGNFHFALARIGVPRGRILHVAQSLFHDHVPAKSLGMTTVWIDRRDGLAGGATPAAAAGPDARFTSMAAFAAEAVPAAH
jgi:2-haloacid dehalogenase